MARLSLVWSHLWGTLLLVLVSLIAGAGEADERFQLLRDPLSGWMLRAPSCADLGPELKAIREWKKDLGETPGLLPPAVSGRGGCVIPLSSSLPSFLVQLVGLGTPQDGPNCWNSALLGHRLESLPRYGSPEEFSTWLESPYCAAVATTDALAPGDVVVVRSLERTYAEEKVQERHAFIYLSDELSFSKNGLQGSVPYRIQSTERVLRTYGVGGEWKRCRIQSGRAAPGSCPKWVEAFRCRNPGPDRDEFEGDPRWNWALEELMRIEVRINSWVFGRSFDASELSTFQMRLDYLRTQFTAHYELLRVGRDQSAWVRRDIFFLDVTLYRISSLKRQLQILYSVSGG